MPEVTSHTSDIFVCIKAMVIQDREARANLLLFFIGNRSHGRSTIISKQARGGQAGGEARYEGRPDIRGDEIQLISEHYEGRPDKLVAA